MQMVGFLIRSLTYRVHMSLLFRSLPLFRSLRFLRRSMILRRILLSRRCILRLPFLSSLCVV